MILRNALLKRPISAITVTVVVLLLMLGAAHPSAALSPWVNDYSIEREFRSIQVDEGGEAEIRFFDSTGKQMGFYKTDDYYVVDDSASMGDYISAGIQFAGTLLTISDYTGFYYLPDMFGHLEIAVKPALGYAFSAFYDAGCGCFTELAEKSAGSDGNVYIADYDAEHELKITFEVTDYALVGSIEEGSVNLMVNNTPVTSDVPAYIENNRTMVPVRFISEALNAEVNWDSGTRRVTIISSSGITIELTIGDTIMAFYGMSGVKTEVIMDVSAEIRGGRTFIPVRYVAEALGLSVFWNDITRTVVLLG